MATFESNHTVIIPQCDQNGQVENIRNTAENVLIPAHLTTLNAHMLHTCEASVDGIDCQAQATQQYTISTTGVTRRLCDVHFRMLLRMVRLWHWRRVMTYVDEQQKGRVA